MDPMIPGGPLSENQLLKLDVSEGRVRGVSIPLEVMPKEYSDAVKDPAVSKIYIPLSENEDYVEISEGNGRVPAIKVGDETYSLPQYISVKKEKNKEAFDKLDPLLGEIYIKVLEDNPALVFMQVKILEDLEYGCFNAAEFSLNLPSKKQEMKEEDFNIEKLSILKGEELNSEIQKIIEDKERNQLIKTFSEMLGISEKETIDNLQLLTLLHEFGHAVHAYSYIQKIGEGGLVLWRLEATNEVNKVKLKGCDANDFRNIFTKRINWKGWYESLTEAVAYNTKIYRESAFEKRADLFMKDYFGRFREKILNR